uniref:3-hydroxyisobutyryl-CoA hydrolase, mitochondrial n=1 Tax=Pristionchus pacificus TaxID=54126 RepID=A0A2A6BBS4_PRIPA|eukprot:PDM63316.1 hypothetical protein PRIPAC_50531 [Pristionchus pacificus]
MAVLLPDGTAKAHQSPQKPHHSPTKRPIVSLNVGSQAKKAIRFFSRAIAAVCACYTSADQVHAEATTSRRMHSLVEHSDLARRQVVGGVEIGTFSLASVSAVELSSPVQQQLQPEQQQVRHQQRLFPLSASTSNLSAAASSLSPSSSQLQQQLQPVQQSAQPQLTHILLRRMSRRHGQIVLTMERLKFMMRRLCVCHSLHIRGVPMDDSLATRLLLADYRAVRDLVVDRVSTVSQENMLKLVTKVCPSQCIYMFNHSSRASTTSLTPALILGSGTTEFAIEAAIGCTFIHPAFDDAALMEIVVHDKLVRRSIRLPLSRITHGGIVEAARAFQSRALQLLDEFPVDSPLWEVIVTLPVSPLIDPSRISLPAEMAPYTRVYFSSMPSVVLEVLINRMNLRVHIDYGPPMLSRQAHWLRLLAPQKTLTIRAMQSAACKEEVLAESVGSKRVVTLNRPKQLNALNLNMVRELYPLMKKWDDGGHVSMVIVKGAGGKAFCAGGDVLAVTKSAQDAKAGGESTLHKDFFREEYQLNHLIGTLSKPYVALIDGITMGGGCGLSVNGRFRVATERTMLSMPETALGLFPDVGGSYFLSRLKNNLGLYLALTGYRLMGADAFHSGLATHFVNSSDIPALEKELLDLDHPTDALVDVTIRKFQPKDMAPFSLEEKLPTIRELFHARTIEEIVANLEKHGDEWAKKTVATLNKMSPTSLKLTMQQIERGARTSYAKCFTMEYRLTQHCMEGFDFHEGCRAILIDKDRNPQWKPATLAEVSEDYIEGYFAPLPHAQELVIHED